MWVSVAGWLVVLGSVFIVLSAFEQISSLSSLDSRQQVEEFLAEPPGDGMGLGVESALDVLHVLSVVSGGCAAAAAVLGFYAMRGHRRARLGLSVVVVPMFVGGLALGGVLTAFVAVGAVALWLQPARDWFDGVSRQRPTAGTPFGPADRGGRGGGDTSHGDEGGREPGDEHEQEDSRAELRDRQPATQGAGPGPDQNPNQGPDQGSDQGSERTDGPEPRAFVGFGQPGAGPAEDAPETGRGRLAPADQPHPGWQRPRPAPQHPGANRAAASRPTAVLVACVLTWATCAIVAAILLGTVAALAAAPDMLLDEVRRQNPEIGAEVARSTLVGATVAIGAVIVLWCAAACVVAFFVSRGRPWARLTLAVSATVAAVGSALLAVGSVVLILPAGAAATTAYCLLFRPEVRRWFGGV